MNQIYMITNLINGKAYIGQHSSGQSWYFGSGTAIKQAIKKYGKSNFKKDILVSGNFEKELLDLLEQEAIDKYQTFAGKHRSKGYNMNIGGSGQKGRVTKVKPSLNFLKRKQVFQYSLDGMFIKRFPSLAKASKSVGITYQAVSNALKGDNYQAGGFQWRHYKALSINKYLPGTGKLKAVKSRQIPVIQLTMDNVPLMRFDSAKQASERTGITVSGIRGCCYGDYSNTKGFRWMFEIKKRHNAIKTSLDNPNNQ
jgi:hypothetical protein